MCVSFSPLHAQDKSKKKIKDAQYKGKTMSQWILLLKDKESSARRKAVYALGRLSRNAGAQTQVDKAIPFLVKALKDKEWSVRLLAASVLRKISPKIEF